MTTPVNMPEVDRAFVRGQPPLYFVASTVVALAIHYGLWPLRFSLPDLGFVGGTSLRIILGVVIGVLGITLFIAAVAQHLRSGDDPGPHTPTTVLLTTGPHQITRNPIYLGVGLVQLGLGMGIGSIWVVASAFLALALAHFLAVRPEETYLEQKFGSAYREYQRTVRRWI